MAVPQLRDYQSEAWDALRGGLMGGYHRQVLCSPTGSGKCHPRGTMLIAGRGGCVPVEEVEPGDLLMGPTGPVEVARTGAGHGMIYEITPVKGEPWRANGEHVLTLLHTSAGEVVDVTVREWMGWSASAKHLHKLYRAPSVFSPRAQPVPPYLMGALMGDGCLLRGRVSLHTGDPEMAYQCIEDATAMAVGYRVEDTADRVTSIHFVTPRGRPNTLLDTLRALGVAEAGARGKRLPPEYVYAGRGQQLEVLAGLIDADGHLQMNGYDYVSASPVLAEQVTFMARSVGLAAYEREKWIRYAGEWRRYHRVSISGNTDMVPCRITRKRAKPRQQRKDVLRTGIKSIRPVGEADFYGFELAGNDPRYLLWDHTVSHNTVVAAAMIEHALDLGSRVTFVVDRVALVNQTSQAFQAFGIPHGVVQAENTHGRSLPVQVCSAQTVEARGYWPKSDLVFVDECHTQRKKVVEWLKTWDGPAIGLTATPLTRGLGLTWERVISLRTTDQLIADGWLAPCRVYGERKPDMEGAAESNGEWTGKAVEERGRVIIGDIVGAYQRRTQEVFGGPVKTLVFSATVKHGEDVCNAFQDAGLDFRQISYRDRDDDRRERLIAMFKAGKITGLVSCEALAKGFDVPDTLCLIDARAYKKSLASHIQVIGRVMRIADGKEFGLVLDHSGNWNRFAADRRVFFRDGPGELCNGKPKKKEPRERREPVEIKCVCGVLMEPGERVCMACGRERVRPPDYRVLPGELVEVRGTIEQGGKVEPDLDAILWDQCCLIARNRKDDGEAAVRAARGYYKNLTGIWPPKWRPFTPSVHGVDPEVMEELERGWKRWREQRTQETML